MQQQQQQDTGVTSMDVDPVDDGPSVKSPPPVPVYGRAPSPLGQPPGYYSELITSMTADSSNDNAAAVPTDEEQAQQCLERLRSDDTALRVAAAHRLDAVAAVLGPARTREVSPSVLQRA